MEVREEECGSKEGGVGGEGGEGGGVGVREGNREEVWVRGREEGSKEEGLGVREGGVEVREGRNKEGGVGVDGKLSVCALGESLIREGRPGQPWDQLVG
ncbi:hypothetical protein Pcinc_023028 [Petrolisthes cinctipes]|uniref:Uncharacterized protein n=1 Tax=Petrolisthes cinctipes TaxID=88211 RepID=A0AAE1KFV9_PETCI|nr:hypothetical protein Pcinc_023028 [Petrolisthes cinctipes]